MSNLLVSARFTESLGLAKTGLTLADIDLYLMAVNADTGVQTEIWDGSQNPTFEISNQGAYGRIYSEADLVTNHYFVRAVYTGAETLDTDESMGVAGLSEDSIWSRTPRSLTSPATDSDSTTAGAISRRRGDTWSIAITGLGDLTGWTVIDFTIKDRLCEVADADAILRIRLSSPGDSGDGLIRLNGADPGDLTAGSITVDVVADGDITIAVDADKTAQLLAKTYQYDVQVIKTAAVTTPDQGTFTVTVDVTLATS
jgi:hypothetical protein